MKTFFNIKTLECAVLSNVDLPSPEVDGEVVNTQISVAYDEETDQFVWSFSGKDYTYRFEREQQYLYLCRVMEDTYEEVQELEECEAFKLCDVDIVNNNATYPAVLALSKVPEYYDVMTLARSGDVDKQDKRKFINHIILWERENFQEFFQWITTLQVTAYNVKELKNFDRQYEAEMG